MISILVSALTSIFLFAIGIYTGAIKKLIATLVKLFYNILQLFGKEASKVEKTEKAHLAIERHFGVRKICYSRENTQKVSLVSYVGICITAIAIAGLLIDSKANSFAVSGRLSELLKIEIATATIYCTSFMFAMISSGVSIIAGQWKKNSDYRKANSRAKIKEAAKRELTEQELLMIVDAKVKEKI